MGLPSSPPRHERDQLKARDPGRRPAILKLKAGGMKHRNIASGANCSAQWVRRVVKTEQLRSDGKDEALKRPWFRMVSDKNLEDLIYRIETARVEGKTIYTSDIADLDKVRLITQAELKANTFPHSWTNEKDKGKGVQWLRDHLRGTKAGSQGFVILKGEAFESERDFVGLLDKREYKTKFYGIFQKLQVALGDKKRWQVKMGDVFKVAAQNVKDAQALVEKVQKDEKKKNKRLLLLQAKQAEFDVVSRMINHQLKVYDIIYKVSRI